MHEREHQASLPEIPGYRVEGMIGAGGEGTVFRGRRLVDQLPVALKLSRTCDRLIAERDFLERVGPPHVPRVYEVGTLPDGRGYLAMEDLGDRTLARLLAGEPLQLPAVVGLSCAVLEAVAGLHRVGIVHLDLKPGNLLVHGDQSDPRVVIIDLGLARTPGSVSSGASARGSPHYMAPEQWDGDALDERADVYAAGVIIYQLLNGRVPFDGTAEQLRRAHQLARLPEPCTAAPTLARVLSRALAKRPDDRFADVRELATALSAAAAQAHSPPTSVGNAAPSREPGPLWLMAFTGAVEPAELERMVAPLGAAIAHTGAEGHVLALPAAQSEQAVALAYAVNDAFAPQRVLISREPVRGRRGGDGRLRVVGTGLDRLIDEASAMAEPGLFVRARREEPWVRVPERPPDDARPPTLVGRERVLALLRGSLESAYELRAPTIATIIGEPGIGKTRIRLRLRDELATRPDLTLIELVSMDSDRGDTFADLIGILLGPDPVVARTRLTDLVGDRIAAEAWPGVASAAGWSRDAEAPFARAPGALRDQAIRAAGEALRALARRSPLAVLVEDAQFADPSTLQSLELAALNDLELPIWIAVFSRGELDNGQRRWAEHAQRHDRQRLGPLSEDAAAQLCRELLAPAEDIPAAVVARLTAATQGIPLHLVELVRNLRRSGAIRPHAAGTGWFIATELIGDLPTVPSIEWMARRELEALGPGLARYAQVSAILGARVDRSRVEAVLRRLHRTELGPELRLDVGIALEHLQRLGVLVTANGAPMFRQELVREAIVRDAAPAFARAVHLAALADLEERNPGEQLGHAAYHAGEAGAPQAADLYLALAERSREGHAYYEAERAFARALAALGDDNAARRMLALRGRGTMRFRLNRHEDALADFAAALELATAADDRLASADILLDEATALDWIDELARSARCVERARELAGVAPAPLLEARLLIAEGRSQARRAERARAAHTLARGIAVCDRIGAEAYEPLVVALLMIGPVQHGLGQRAEARATFERLLRLTEASGDRLHLAATLNNRRYVFIETGDFDQLRKDADRCIELGRELGLSHFEFGACHNMGEILMRAGRVDEAESYVRRAVRSETRRATRVTARLLEIRWLLSRGDRELARQRLDAVRELECSGGAAIMPDETLLARMCELATHGADADAWEVLLADAARAPADDRAEVERMAARWSHQ